MRVGKTVTSCKFQGLQPSRQLSQQIAIDPRYVAGSGVEGAGVLKVPSTLI
jgi:hypothetical protein